MLKAIFTWLISRLFGGDKTAELAEAKGKLEAENAQQQGEIAATSVRNGISDNIDRLSDSDVTKQLHDKYEQSF